MLRFALEIREELGQVDDKPSDLPVRQVESAVVNYIYGGTNVIAGTASDFTQLGTVVVGKGNFSSLADALKRLDVPQGEVDALKEAVDADQKRFGTQTKEWVLNIGAKLGSAGMKIGTEASSELVKGWLHQYFS